MKTYRPEELGIITDEIATRDVERAAPELCEEVSCGLGCGFWVFGLFVIACSIIQTSLVVKVNWHLSGYKLITSISPIYTLSAVTLVGCSIVGMMFIFHIFHEKPIN